MYKKILVPLDGSYQAMYRSVAARLLQKSDCSINESIGINVDVKENDVKIERVASKSKTRPF